MNPSKFASGHGAYNSLWRFVRNYSLTSGGDWNILVIVLNKNEAFPSSCTNDIRKNPDYKLKFKTYNPEEFDKQYQKLSKY